METLLVVITLISVATAIVALTSATRLRRHERERSEARVAALAAAADMHGSADGGWRQVAGEWQWMASRDERLAPAAAPLTVPLSAVAEPSDKFFGTVQRDESASSRWPVFAVAAVMLMLLGGALLFLNSSASSSDQATTTTAAAGHSDPLELVALAHEREVKTHTLTITGTVRNPSSGGKLEGLTAVISLLDRDGGLVSTKDVPLDYRAIGPGEEAPFKVTIPDPGSVARYRVSFRAGTDVVPHVDRRVDTKLASSLR